MNTLYIITGPAGSGKTTVSNKLANKLSKSVLIEGDTIYNQFVAGRISPYKEEAPIDLFYKICFDMIGEYLKEGYDVVFNYILMKEDFKKFTKKFKNYNIKFSILFASGESLLKRDSVRPLDCQMKERCLILLNEFKEQDYNNNYFLNNDDNIDINVTVNEILENDRFIYKRKNIGGIKTPEDVLEYMKDNIDYGWLDLSNNIHLYNMKNFRRIYRTSSIEEILDKKIGTCIEQVYLMNYLLNKINVKNKMFCTRIYEPNDYNKLDSDEHMHCFILYYLNNKVYHLEHPNFNKIGIYEYENEEEALKKINDYFVNMSKGVSRPLTEFGTVNPNLTFKEFNNYINSLDK